MLNGINAENEAPDGFAYPFCLRGLRIGPWLDVKAGQDRRGRDP